MRRVRKEEVTIDTWIKPDGYSRCMDCWKRWMDADDRDLSASRPKYGEGAEEDDEDGGNRPRVAYESDPYEEQRKADYRIGEATNAMIDSLKQLYRWAIYKQCGITTQWRFPAMNLLVVLPEAENKLEEMLRKNIVTGTLF